MINVYKTLMNNKSNNKDIKEIRNTTDTFEKNHENICPYCQGGHVIKFGFYNGIQRYKCKNWC